jgi:alpha/beta superfamily hydrolase
MNSKTERLQVNGQVGIIECLKDLATPEVELKGWAFVAHPHPLFGGTMDNKVVQTLARAFAQNGWNVLRFNFRGVGQSQGPHDNGQGEAQDLQFLIEQFAPNGPIAMAGFSFGAYVTSTALSDLRHHRANDIQAIILVGTAASRFTVPAIDQTLHDKVLVLHGEVDDTVPLQKVFDWARPQALAVTVIPGVEHFFHGQLPLLKNLVSRHLRKA